MNRDPKKVVREIVQLVGKPRAVKLLISAGDISPSAAGKLANGKYTSEVGALVAAAILKARLAAEELANAG